MIDVSSVIETAIEDAKVLEHYGVPGMKWGRRRARSSGDGKPARPATTGGRATKPSPDKSSDFKKTADLRGKKVTQLSDKQLKKINERMNLEKNYKKLNPTKIERGEAQLKKLHTTYLTLAAVAGTAIALSRTEMGKKVIGNVTKKITGNKVTLPSQYKYKSAVPEVLRPKSIPLPKKYGYKIPKTGTSGLNPFKSPF